MLLLHQDYDLGATIQLLANILLLLLSNYAGKPAGHAWFPDKERAKKIHLKLVYVKGWITVWHKQTAQHIILFTWDQRTFVSLSPEGDTCSNNVQTSFAQGSELQEKGREKWVLSVLWERNLVMGNWCCSTLQYFLRMCRCMFSFVFLERVQPIAGDLCSSIKIKEPLYLSQICFNFYFLDSSFHQKK